MKRSGCWVLLIFMMVHNEASNAQRSFSQHEVLFAGSSNAAIFEVDMSNGEKDSLYQLLARDTDYCGSESKNYRKIFEIDEFIAEHEHHFTFTRLNDDPYVDVVFDGMACSGHESSIVEILLGTPKGFKKIFFHWGRIMRYQPSSVGHEFLVHHYPCCAAFTNAYIQLELPRTKDTIAVTEMRLLASPHTSQGPFYPKTTDRFELIKISEPVMLRWSPDTVALDLLNGLENNVVARYGVNSEGVLLYKQENGPWGFVLMRSEPIDHILEVEHLPRSSYLIYGWLDLSAIPAK